MLISDDILLCAWMAFLKEGNGRLDCFFCEAVGSHVVNGFLVVFAVMEYCAVLFGSLCLYTDVSRYIVQKQSINQLCATYQKPEDST